MRQVNPLLGAALKKLAAYYSRPGLEEVAINRPGEVYVKYAGTSNMADNAASGWQAIQAPEITHEYLTDLCVQLANATRQKFDPVHNPLLYADLPEGHRFTAIIGGNVQYDNFDNQGVAITIRLFAPDKSVDLKLFGLQEGMPLQRAGSHAGRVRYADSPLEDLVMAVQHGEAVLISGATATGKTTFLNNLIQRIDMDKRVITVEDVRELKVPQKNHVHLVASRTQSSNTIDDRALLDVVVRMTPDVLICGEIGIKNAAGIYRLMTTGHSNFMCTIHAHSPELAIRAFWQNLTQSMPGLDAKSVMEVIAAGFGRIVQIEREGRNRVITAIDMPKLSVGNLMDTLQAGDQPTSGSIT